MKKHLCLLALVLVAAIANERARADHGSGFGLGYIYGQGYGYNYGGPNSVIRPYSPPYFSIHPPVYYGKRYTRPYGASPFAAWPQLQPASGYAPRQHVDRAQIIPNPHIPCVGPCTCGNCLVSTGQPSGSLVKQVEHAAPLVIENPYYQPPVQYTSADQGKID